MADLAKATATQLANIERKSGKSLAHLKAAIAASGLTKHGEIRDWLVATYDVGHGDANAVIHFAKQSDAGAASGDVLGDIYAGKKAHLRPIHEKLMAGIEKFGPFEIAPKKGYVSLRRAKQFAMLGPKTSERFELGLNLKEDAGDPRAKAQAPGGMCQYIVALTDPKEVDAKLIALLKRAYERAG